ncbi:MULTISPECIES: flagellar motor switch protein FliM [Exiguobacterium]|uniref:Flagellar motor switch protein FliM n=2 Tax=Exiguobacterium TaxID=33986 RepID=C4L633_EXISA|nr:MULTISPECIES: flagellar motor switch protein FliM [Exiguobacterium]ACQ71839.1 flagellar motor switch protein FliM [Exiguobacterium sp. AT1b]MCM3279372.1 flagellar motor switch protein FliM [Exiguobacterium sp. MER 193]WED54193.1 flagellar motor switch protein FliM [Exiguobacterium profundum]
MGEVLSQQEIDALLSALSSGDVEADSFLAQEEEKKVRQYDFKRAVRFSKDQIRSLTRIHEHFTRMLTTFFSAQLRTYVQFSVNSVEQLPYDEFIHSIPSMTMINLIEAPPLNGRFIIEVNPNISYAMLDRLLGGPGVEMDKIESFTEIEMRILTQLYKRAFSTYGDAWESIAEIKAEMSAVEVNPQFLQLVSPNETVVLISIGVTIGEVSGTINVCLPFVTIEPVLSKLSSHYWMQEANRRNASQSSKEPLKAQLMNSTVEVVSLLGETTITFGDLLHLEVGDCLALDQLAKEPLSVMVGENKVFKGQVGVSGKRMAVQVLHRVKEEEQ